jgi:hypothetical protein
MRAFVLAALLAVCGTLAAFACSQEAPLPVLDVEITGASLRNGEQVLWSSAGGEGSADAGAGDGSIEVTSATLAFGLEVTAPQGTWPVTVSAEGALSTTPAPDGGVTTVNLAIGSPDGGAASSKQTVFVPMYLVAAEGAATVHVGVGSVTQAYDLKLHVLEPTLGLCGVLPDIGCITANTSPPLDDAGEPQADYAVDAQAEDAEADDASDAQADAAGLPACLTKPSLPLTLPLPQPTLPFAEGDLLLLNVGASDLAQPWTASFIAGGTLAFALDGGATGVASIGGDAGDTARLAMNVHAPGPGSVASALFPSAETTINVVAGAPRLAIRSVSAGGSGQYFVTVCSGAQTGAITVTTTAGTLVNATAPISPPTTGECGPGYAGFALFVWSGAAGPVGFTMMYSGGVGSVTQFLCGPAPFPFVLDAGLDAIPDGSAWPPPISPDDAGPFPTYLLVNVTLDSNGSAVSSKSVSYVASTGTPPAGTFTTDSNGHGFFTLTEQPGVTTVDVQLSVGNQSTTLQFTEQGQ